MDYNKFIQLIPNPRQAFFYGGVEVGVGVEREMDSLRSWQKGEKKNDSKEKYSCLLLDSGSGMVTEL